MSRLLQFARWVVAVIGSWWLVATLTPVNIWWTGRLAQPWGDGQGKVLIVLSGDEMPDGILGATSYLRAVYAIRAMRACHFDKVYITGGTYMPGSRPPAELIRDFIAGHGIDVSNVVVESKASSTRENALQVKALLDGQFGAGQRGKLVLLTSDFHTWRAVHVFRKLGMDVDAAPAPDILKRTNNWPLRAYLFHDLALETIKIGWYWFQGWI